MNVVFDLGAVLLSWEPVALVQANFERHAPTAEAAHALAMQMFHHEDWLGFDRGTPFGTEESREISIMANLNTCHVWAEDGELIPKLRAGGEMERPVWIRKRMEELGLDETAVAFPARRG